jgi:hypothetical protein
VPETPKRTHLLHVYKGDPLPTVSSELQATVAESLGLLDVVNEGLGDVKQEDLLETTSEGITVNIFKFQTSDV